MSSGDYIAFLDNDDKLTRDALYEVVKILNKEDFDIIYTDSDKISVDGSRFEPFYKPDWSPEFFRGVMYVGHLLVVKKSLAQQVGLLNKEYDFIQDYELILRISEKTDKIYHIPKILYHWRQIKGSIAADPNAKAKINQLQEKAVNEHLKRMQIKGIAKNNGKPHRINIFPTKKENYPFVSIIIPTKDSPKFLQNCLQSVFKTTSYPNYEVILIDNNTTDEKAIKVMKSFAVKIIPFKEKFNFSKQNNLGVNESKGEYIILLNNDTEVITKDWIQNMLLYAEQADVGAVGPLLFFPDQTVQHAGVVLGFRGTADHIMRGFHEDSDGYSGSLCCAREVSAVTAACMMLKKSVYEEVGGFNVHYATIYQDVDLCLKIRKKGLRIIYTPTAKLYHYEGRTRDLNIYDMIDRILLLDEWEAVIKKGDPYYNPNFDLTYTREKTGYSLPGR